MMSENLKAITEKIRHPNYGMNPMGMSIDLPWGNDVMETIQIHKTLPKVEKKAIARDMTPHDAACVEDLIYQLQEKCRYNLVFLANRMMKFEKVRPDYPYIQDAAKFLAQDALRMLLLASRWFLKTTLLSVYIVQNILRDFENTWMLKSGVYENAQQVLKLIYYRSVTPEMQEVWGDLRGDTWSFSALDFAYRKPSQQDRVHNIDISGAQSETTGRHYTNGGFDDLTGEKNTETEAQMKKAWDDYQYKLLLIDNIILQTATRWKPNDVPGRILEENEGKPDSDPLKYKIFFRPGETEISPKVYVPTFPEEYPREWLEARRSELAAFRYSAQILLKPIAEDEQIFKEQDILPYMYDSYFDIKDIILRLYIITDPASSQARHADRTAIGVLGVSPTYHVYVMDERVGKFSTVKTIDHIFELREKWRDFRIGDFKPDWTLHKTGMEKGGYEKTVKSFLKERMEMTGDVFKMYPLEPGHQKDAKIARALGFAPWPQNGMFHVLSTMKDYRNEIIGFGATRYDDRVDMTTYIFQLAKKPAKPPSEKKEPTRQQIWHQRNLLKSRMIGNRRAFLNQGARV